jgi:hypothetical protein
MGLFYIFPKENLEDKLRELRKNKNKNTLQKQEEKERDEFACGSMSNGR